MRMRRSGMSLVEVLVVITIVAILFALMLPAIQQARSAARTSNCRSNLRQMGIALLSFESAQRKFPMVKSSQWPNGYMPADEVWSGGAFTPYIEDSKAVPWCPSDPHPHEDNTSYAFVFNTQAGICSQEFQRTVPGWVVTYMGGGPHVPPQHTVFGINVAMRSKRITDGLSKTVAFGEIRMGDDRSRKHKNAIYSHLHTPNSPEADVSRGDVDASLAPVSSGDHQYCVTANNSARSYHPGGVYVVFLDGHAQLISNDVDVDVWREYATINSSQR